MPRRTSRYMSILALLGMFIFIIYRLHRRIIALVFRLRQPQHRVSVQRGLRVPMSDGVQLTADHYSPRRPGSYPTILIRSPYGRHYQDSLFGITMMFVAHRFAERGYNVIVQDVRGRFGSGGKFLPYINEKADGLATIEWLKRQPWFDGRVGMWGASYLGLVQWALSTDAPEVKALVPIVTGANPYTILFPDGAFDLGLAVRWLSILHDLQDTRDKPLWRRLGMWANIERRVQPAFDTVPIIESDREAVGQPVEFYRLWLAHTRQDDEMWRAFLKHNDISRTRAQAHLIGGWYDFFLRALLQDYETLRARGHQPYLTIGMWNHFEMTLNDVDLREGLAWCDAHLKNRHSALRSDTVRVYVMGARRWRGMSSWPPPANETAFYLTGAGGLGDAPPMNSVAPSRYRYDPNDPTPAFAGAIFSPTLAGRRDNRRMEARDDVLTFTTPPLDSPLEIIGYVRAHLYVASSRCSADFFVRLCDVYPDGASYNVCDGLFRLLPDAERDADGIARVTVDMWATAHEFRRGHRIRVQVSSGAHPRWLRNSGTDQPFPQAITFEPADQTIYHDAAHPSALILPVYT
ncbi:MAG: CocE/NonD family hydrolase [Anaerolineaceae bacterium]|nr:MAG: CocE/NonD family hydrolase [Anaerolineaceae bacterium]